MIGIWSAEEKQEWLLEQLRAEAKNTGKNEVSFTPITVTDGEDDFAAVLFDRSEQEGVLFLLSLRDLVDVKSPAGKQPFIVKLLSPPRPAKSMYFKDGYKTLRDVLLNYELRTELTAIICRAYGVVSERQIKKGLSVKTEIDENRDGRYQDEKVMLLEELGILKADWAAMKKQKHRTVGNRLIPVLFVAEKVAEFVGSIIGLKAIIKPKALELISGEIVAAMPDTKWSDFLSEAGVPETLFLNDLEPKEMLNTVFVTLVSTGNADDFIKFKRIIELLIHPLFNKGDKKRASNLSDKISGFLEYDGLVIRAGKVVTLDEENTGGPWDKFPAYVDLLPKLDYYFHVKAFAAMLFDILEANGNANLHVANEYLNYIYTLLHHYLGILLERREGESFKSEYVQLPDTLLDPSEDYDISWEYGHQQALNKIIAATSRQIILGGDPGKLNLPDFIKEYQKITKESTVAHKKHVTALFDNVLRGIDEKIKENPYFPPGKSGDHKEGQSHPINITNIINNVVGDQTAPSEKNKTTNIKESAFDDTKTALTVNGVICALPPYKNEHYFCREMYKYLRGEAVDWSSVYEAMQGRAKDADEKKKRMVYDTMKAVNRRIQETLKTEDDLFVMREKSIIRMF